MSDTTIHVCYCGNKKIFHGMLLSALSLAMRTKRPLHLYILSMDLHEQDPSYLPFSQNQMDILNEALRKFNADSCAEQRDLRDLYLKMQKHNKNAHNMYTPYAQLRLYLTELENIPDKILYLDVDTMCMKDVGELYDIDISDYEYGAVIDNIGRVWTDKHYCNSGVLLLNLPKIRQTHLFERVRQRICEKWMWMPDQSALHELGSERLYLPRKFNEQSRKLRDDTVIKHFCKGIKVYLFLPLPYNVKQWERKKVHKKLKYFCFDDIYQKYDEIAKKYNIEQ